MPAASTPVIDTHRHPFGPGAKQLFSAIGAYHPDRPLPQAARGNVFYAAWLDEQTTVAGSGRVASPRRCSATVASWSC